MTQMMTEADVINGVLAPQEPAYPQYYMRCETGYDEWHQVSKATYYWYEARFRWGCQWEPPDGSRFSGLGIQGYVRWNEKSEPVETVTVVNKP